MKQYADFAGNASRYAKKIMHLITKSARFFERSSDRRVFLHVC